MVLPGRAVPELVGREDERAELHAFVAAAWPAAPLLLLGEAGVGKSTLLADAVAYCRSLGRRVLTTSAAAPEEEMASGGLVHLFGDLIDPLLAELPELPREAVEVAFLRRRATERPGQLALGTGILHVLQSLAADGPLLIAVDDLQWLDQESVLALGFSLRRITAHPVALLATARVPDPVIAPAPTVPMITWAHTMTLGPLGHAEFPDLLRHNGFELSRDIAEQLHTGSGGNPGWALEAVAGRAAHAEVLPLPAASAVQVRDRLAALDEPVRAVLRTVAAAGTIAVDPLCAVLTAEPDMPEDPAAARDAVYDAQAAQVVTETGGLIEVAHPLLAAAALGDLPPARRRALHAALLDALPDAEARAYHLQRSAEPGRDRDTANTLMVGARQARGRGAADAAARMAEQALSRAPAGEHPAWLVDAAGMQFSVGAFHRACELLAALDFTAVPLTSLDRALVMLVEAIALTRGTQVAAGLVTELRTVLSADEARLAVLCGIGADTDLFGAEQVRELAAQALATLPAGVAALARYRALGALLETAPEDAEPDRALLAERDGLLGVLAERGLAEWATPIRGLDVDLKEDPSSAEVVLRERRDLAAAHGERYAAALATAGLAAAELSRGRYAAADELLDGLDLAAFGDVEPPLLLATRGALLIGTGRFADLRALLSAPDATRAGGADYRELYVLGLTGMAANRELRWSDAVTALTKALAVVPRLGRVRHASRPTLEGELVEALIGVDRLAEARTLTERFAASARRAAQPTRQAVADRLRGMCAAAAGDLTAAEPLLAASVAAFEDTSLQVDLARSLLELGRVRRRRRGRRSARDTLRRACRMFTEIGDVPLGRQADAELARLATVRENTELTAAEHRVAELVVGGSSNREVAAALFVSVRTVESHIQSVYRKLGVHSRTQLAAMLLPGDAVS